MVKPIQAVFIAALTLIAPPAFAGSINWGTFGGVKAEYRDVTESGPDVNPPSSGLFVPEAPTYSENPNPQLTFLPQNFVQTDQNVVFDLKSKTVLLAFAVAAKPLPGDPNYLGYALTGSTINLAGTYSVWAPFGAGEMGSGSPASTAKVTMAAAYTIQVTGVNWGAYSGGSALNRTMPIVPTDVTVTGPQNAATTGNWAGTSTINWNDVRIAAGVGANDVITELSIQLTADIAAAGVYGTARTTVTNLNVINPVDPIAVPVPEPPTIILASLGAVAVVANGYRRRKQRRTAESLADESDLPALSA